MAIKDFWNNIRAGASLTSSQAVVDSPRLNAERIESILRSATSWLTPKSVEGYDPDDFDFLADEERQRLTDNIKHFRATASKVPHIGPPTNEQIREAMPEFENILKTIRPDRYGDLDAFVLGKKIEREVSGTLPQWARELIFETGFDVSGEPALWIWVEVDDKALDETEVLRRFDSVREELRTAALRICPGRWPFIRLREASERKATEEVRPKKRKQKTRK